MKRTKILALALMGLLFLLLPLSAGAADWSEAASALQDPGKGHTYTVAAGDSLVIPSTATELCPDGELIIKGECLVENGANVFIKTVTVHGDLKTQGTLATLGLERLNQYGTVIMAGGRLEHPVGTKFEDVMNFQPGSVTYGTGDIRDKQWGPTKAAAYRVFLDGGEIVSLPGIDAFSVWYPDIYAEIPSVFTPTKENLYFTNWSVRVADPNSGSYSDIVALWSSTPPISPEAPADQGGTASRPAPLPPPKTGDFFPMEILGGLMLVLLGAAGIITYRRRAAGD